MGIFSKNYEAIQIDSTLKEHIGSNRPRGILIQVRPYPKNESIKGSQELLRIIYNTFDKAVFSMFNTSKVSTFEIWYNDGQVNIYYYLEKREDRQRFLKQLGAFFPGAEVKTVAHHFPEVEEGEWISGSRFHLRNHYFEPIRHPGGSSGMQHDPYKNIINDLTAKADTRAVIQVAMRPTAGDWTSTYTRDVADYGEKIKSKEKVTTLEGLTMKEKEVSPPQHVRSAASDIISQKGKPGFYVNLRMISIGPSKEQAISQAKSIGRIYEQTHEEVTGQSLSPKPQIRGEIPALINDVCERRGKNMNRPKNPITILSKKLSRLLRGSYKTMIMTMPEVAALAHIPDESINNNMINWNRTNISGVIPAEAPEFETYHGGTPDDPRAEGGELVEPEVEPGGEDFESQWENADEAIDKSGNVDKLIDESMDQPADEFIE